jgi:hypothetical protein
LGRRCRINEAPGRAVLGRRDRPRRRMVECGGPARVPGGWDPGVGWLAGDAEDGGGGAGAPQGSRRAAWGYDPARITYNDLLDVFWQLHDPTSLANQGPYELAANIVGSSLSTTPTKKPRQVRQRRRWNAERPTMGRSSPRYGPPRGFGPRRTLTNATSERAARIIATSSIERLSFLPGARLNTRCKTGRLTASTPDLDI